MAHWLVVAWRGMGRWKWLGVAAAIIVVASNSISSASHPLVKRKQIAFKVQMTSVKHPGSPSISASPRSGSDRLRR
jgi:hypothetical protein